MRKEKWIKDLKNLIEAYNFYIALDMVDEISYQNIYRELVQQIADYQHTDVYNVMNQLNDVTEEDEEDSL